MVDRELLTAAREALNHFPIEPVDVSLATRSENITFKVADNRGDLYALRLHRPGYHTLEELQSERLWTRALLQAGIHVPQPINTRDGREYAGVHVPLLGQHRHASLSRWVPGELLIQLIRDDTPRERLQAHFQTLGALIATMNNRAADWHPPPEFRRHALDADGLMGTQPFWGRSWERSTTGACPCRSAPRTGFCSPVFRPAIDQPSGSQTPCAAPPIRKSRACTRWSNGRNWAGFGPAA